MMKDVKCPICGFISKSVSLLETDGWMICSRCKSETKSIVRMPKIPEYNDTQSLIVALKKK